MVPAFDALRGAFLARLRFRRNELAREGDARIAVCVDFLGGDGCVGLVEHESYQGAFFGPERDDVPSREGKVGRRETGTFGDHLVEKPFDFVDDGQLRAAACRLRKGVGADETAQVVEKICVVTNLGVEASGALPRRLEMLVMEADEGVEPLGEAAREAESRCDALQKLRAHQRVAGHVPDPFFVREEAGGLSRVVEKRRPARQGAGRGALDDVGCVLEYVVDMPGAALIETPHGRKLRHDGLDHVEMPHENLRGVFAAEEKVEFLLYPLACDPPEKRGAGTHGAIGPLLELEAELGGESDRAHDAQGIFFDPPVRIADAADDAFGQVVCTAEWVDDPAAGVIGDRVDREVAARQVIGDIGDEADRIGMASVAVSRFDAVGGYLACLVVFDDGDGTVVCARFVYPIALDSEGIAHVGPDGVGRYVDIFGDDAPEGVAHASSDEPCFESCAFQDVECPECMMRKAGERRVGMQCRRVGQTHGTPPRSRLFFLKYSRTPGAESPASQERFFSHRFFVEASFPMEWAWLCLRGALHVVESSMKSTPHEGTPMIDEIHILDLALIKEATFAPCPSLTVVTGESGAGKSAVLDALKLVIGERSDVGMVGPGAEELRVEGRFFRGEGDDETVVSRRVSRSSRPRVSIDGSIASVKELSAGIGQSVDLCGQHEHQRLLSPSYQRMLLDRWGADELSAPLARYRELLARAEAAAARLAHLESLAEADDVELDRARFALEQIDAVDPQEGEYEQLLSSMGRLENAETLSIEAETARRALVSSSGALEHLESALASLERISSLDDSLSAETSVIREAYFTVEDAGRTLAAYRDGIDFPRDELEAAQERLSDLQRLMRGFGPRMEDVFAKRRDARSSLEEYEGRDELIAQAREARDGAEGELAQAAAELLDARKGVVPRFLSAVSEQLARLEMASAHLAGDLVPLPREEWTEWGPCSFELLFASSETSEPQRLARIASGGEVSRVMLALKVVIGACDDVETLVFDEIDAGVGGHTALALGEVIEDLSRTHQVIVVTHLPQVAVKGDAHYVVEKSDCAEPETTVRPIEGEERVAEIARMLAGGVDEASLSHARSLLETAKKEKADVR